MNSTNWFILQILFACGILAGLGYCAHKIRRVHLLLFEVRREGRERAGGVSAGDLDNLFRQVEALAALYADLRFEKSLLPTRGWAGSPDFLRTVAAHALSVKPKVVLECGSGVSTVVLARCMERNAQGHVYTLEHDARYAEATRLELERHGLSGWATVLHAPLRNYDIHGEQWPWYAVERILPDEIDMFVIDGPPGHIRSLARYPAAPLMFGTLKIAGTIFLDDAARKDEQAVLERWSQEFPMFRRESVDCEKGCEKLIRDR